MKHWWLRTTHLPTTYFDNMWDNMWDNMRVQWTQG